MLLASEVLAGISDSIFYFIVSDYTCIIIDIIVKQKYFREFKITLLACLPKQPPYLNSYSSSLGHYTLKLRV